MNTVQTLKEKAMQGVSITKEEALSLADQPLDELCQAANELREHFCDNVFDLCSIINGKSGKCSENCKYCAQSSHFCTAVEEYPLLDSTTIFHEKPAGITRNQIAAAVINHVLCLCNQLQDRSFIAEYKARSIVLGKDIEVIQGTNSEKATAIDIDENGGLMIEKQDGTITSLHSGEISIRGNFAS